MQEQYIKDEKIKEKTDKEKEQELVKNIVKTRERLKLLDKNFECAENGMVDYYAYELKASQSKLDYLIRLAKNNGISLDMMEAIKIKLYSQDDEVV
ncbi:MAG: DUF2508 family protein [Clostridia bacterium]|nr:DUF2508 family protein [Clostridia bacterium]